MSSKAWLLSVVALLLCGCVGMVVEYPRQKEIVIEDPAALYQKIKAEEGKWCQRLKDHSGERYLCGLNSENQATIYLALGIEIPFDYMSYSSKTEYVAQNKKIVSASYYDQHAAGLIFGLVIHGDVFHICKYGNSSGIEYCGH